MKRGTKIIMPVAVLLAGALSMFGLFSLKSDSPKRTPKIQTKIVETAVVDLKPIPTQIKAYGRVTSSQPVQLYAEVGGTLEPGDVSFKPAQAFSKGDLLLKIDHRQALLDLNSRKSALMTALANVLPEIKVDFPNEYQVWQEYFNSCQFGSELSPLPETDNPKIKLFLSRFNVYTIYFSVRDFEILLDKHYFYALFDGSIVTAHLRVGSTARVGSMLGEIINLEQMEVSVPIEAGDVRWIDRSQQVTFTSSEMSGKWTGRIERVGADIDTRTQTVELYMSIDDGQEASLLNGAFLNAHIPGRSIDNGFSIPPKAVYEDRYVYVIENGKLQRREVVILRRETNRVILNGGVADGDTLVTEIMQGVAPGMPARSRTMSTENRGH